MVVFNTQEELFKYILDNNLEAYGSSLEERKVYVRDTKTKSDKRILTLNY